MIGREWSWNSTALRITMLPAIVAAPLVSLLVHHVPAATCFALASVWIAWTALVVARITLNEHRAQSDVPPFRPFRKRR